MGEKKELPMQHLGNEEYEAALKTEWPFDMVTSKKAAFNLIVTESQYYLRETTRYKVWKYY